VFTECVLIRVPCCFVSQVHIPWLVVAERLRELPRDSLSRDDAAQLGRGLRLLSTSLSTRDLGALRNALSPFIDFADLNYSSTDADAESARASGRRSSSGVTPPLLKVRPPKEQKQSLAGFDDTKLLLRVQDERLLASEISGTSVSSTLVAPEMVKSTGSGRDAKSSAARQQASDLQSMQSLLPAELNELLSASASTSRGRAAVRIVLARVIDSLHPAAIAEVMCRVAAQPMHVRSRTRKEHHFASFMCFDTHALLLRLTGGACSMAHCG
jgi:hypothetical protein